MIREHTCLQVQKSNSYKIGVIIIKGQGGTHAYKQKSQIQYKNGLIIIIKGLGGTQA